MSARFNTKKVRFSYPHISKPQGEGDEARYSLTVLIPKTDKETLKAITDAAKEVFEENKTSAFKGLNYDEVMKPWHDGDGRKPKGGAYGDECKGQIVLNTKSKNKVPCFNRDRQPLADETQVYAGCYGRVSVGLYAYDTKGNKGIGAALNGIMTFNYGDPLGNAFSASEFDDGYEDPDDNLDDDLGI